MGSPAASDYAVRVNGELREVASVTVEGSKAVLALASADAAQLAAAALGISDLEPLTALAALEPADLSGNRIAYLAALGGLYGLERLDLSGNRVTDLGPLAGLPKLRVLLLDGNEATGRRGGG